MYRNTILLTVKRKRKITLGMLKADRLQLQYTGTVLAIQDHIIALLQILLWKADDF